MNAPKLSAWDEMSDLDKGAALLHVWKCSWEGVSYAGREYPARYLESPVLMALDRVAANKHARAVTGGWDAINNRIGVAEAERLYDAALEADRKRILGGAS